MVFSCAHPSLECWSHLLVIFIKILVVCDCPSYINRFLIPVLHNIYLILRPLTCFGIPGPSLGHTSIFLVKREAMYSLSFLNSKLQRYRRILYGGFELVSGYARCFTLVVKFISVFKVSLSAYKITFTSKLSYSCQLVLHHMLFKIIKRAYITWFENRVHVMPVGY
jgi:hypothetical protein